MDVDSDEVSSLRQAIERLEQRQVVAEKEIESLQQQVFRLRRRFWRKMFQPQLWNYHQHPPRSLTIPDAYRAEQPPQQAPGIAIVTPSFNQGAFLRETIESVLTQQYGLLSYHVQDGGSTDGTQQILQSYNGRLSWHSETDRGQADAVNRGFASLDGEVMGFLNSDDVLLPGALAFIAQAVATHPDIDIFYGHRINIDRNGKEIGRCVLPPHHATALTWGDYIPQETMFWRRRVWDAVGPLDERLQFALDWDFILRAQAAGFRFRRLPRFLACFRVHNEQKTFLLTDTSHREMAEIRKRHGSDRTKRARRAFRAYLRRQGVYHRLHKFGILRY